jgi:hypothetical protein
VKLRNEYLDSLGGYYSETPKAVLAALVVSFAARLGTGSLDDISPAAIVPVVLAEWRTLHAAGIVPQSPPKASGGGA